MKKSIIIKSNVELPEFGGIQGPLLRPVEAELDTIYKMLSRGIVIYEVNKYNPNETVRLDKTNTGRTNFFKKKHPVKQIVPTYKKSEDRIVSEIKKDENHINNETGQNKVDQSSFIQNKKKH